jgi:hypothetical protein
VGSVCGSGPHTTVVRELARHKLNLVGLQGLGRTKEALQEPYLKKVQKVFQGAFTLCTPHQIFG